MIEVSDGYARNFMLPKKLAIEATTDAINTRRMNDKATQERIAKEKAKEKERLAREKAKAKAKEQERLAREKAKAKEKALKEKKASKNAE